MDFKYLVYCVLVIAVSSILSWQHMFSDNQSQSSSSYYRGGSFGGGHK